jgi:hypothetical protein
MSTATFSYVDVKVVLNIDERKKIHVLVKECFGAVLPEPVEGMRDRWAGLAPDWGQ